MSHVRINFSELQDASNTARTLATGLRNYAVAVRGNIVTPISNLPGNDSRGYATGASSAASRKIRELNEREERFRNLSQNIARFAENARNADVAVAQSMRNVTGIHPNQQNRWRIFSNAVSSFLLPGGVGGGSLSKFFASFGGHSAMMAINLKRNVVNWFAHGNGRNVFKNTKNAISIAGDAMAGIQGFANNVLNQHMILRKGENVHIFNGFTSIKQGLKGASIIGSAIVGVVAVGSAFSRRRDEGASVGRATAYAAGEAVVQGAGFAGAWAGAKGGAKLGAKIGSIIPGKGTAVGAVVGGAIGAIFSIGGGMAGRRAAESDARRGKNRIRNFFGGGGR
ncbi:MAG: hypothetical protein FWB96_06175 [Defluviitaleaceae bacterium]|nr:hypothetical protein [Defluviitaleaceae bacterium]MCL2262410.1 hypothetical protein [Defluviitaleaceae bacterium]